MTLTPIKQQQSTTASELFRQLLCFPLKYILTCPQTLSKDIDASLDDDDDDTDVQAKKSNRSNNNQDSKQKTAKKAILRRRSSGKACLLMKSDLSNLATDTDHL